MKKVAKTRKPRPQPFERRGPGFRYQPEAEERQLPQQMSESRFMKKPQHVAEERQLPVRPFGNIRPLQFRMPQLPSLRLPQFPSLRRPAPRPRPSRPQPAPAPAAPAPTPAPEAPVFRPQSDLRSRSQALDHLHQLDLRAPDLLPQSFLQLPQFSLSLSCLNLLLRLFPILVQQLRQILEVLSAQILSANSKTQILVVSNLSKI